MFPQRPVLFPARPLACLLALLSLLTFANVAQAKPPRAAKTVAPTPQTPAERAEILRLLSLAATLKKKHPQASAIVLLDKTDFLIRKNGATRISFRRIVRILNSAGRDSEANFSQSYNGSRETVQILRARTIRVNGTVVKVPPKDIYDQDAASGDEIDDGRVTKFTFAAAEPGSILEYESVLDEREPLLKGHSAGSYVVSRSSETRPEYNQQYTIRAASGHKLRTSLRNPDNLFRERTQKLPDGGTLYTCIAGHLPALPVEPMSYTDPLEPRLEYTTLRDWQTVARWDWSLIKDRVAADADLRKTTEGVVRGKTTPEARAKAIFYYVQDKIRYHALEVGMGGVGEWVFIADDEANRTYADATVTVDLAASGDAKARLTVGARGITAMGMRPLSLVTDAEQRRRIAESITKSLLSDARLGKYSMIVSADRDSPVEIWVDATAPGWATRAGDLMLFKARPNQKTNGSSNPLTRDTRKLPVVSNSAPVAGVSVMEIRLPEEATVLSHPENLTLLSPLGDYRRMVTRDGDVLRFRVETISRRANVPVSRYAEIRRYFDDIVKAGDELVVLKLPRKEEIKSALKTTEIAAKTPVTTTDNKP